jgi:hypothetical protein
MAPYRKKFIKDAACYNCVEPHYELLHCMRKGSWFDQFNGCYEQNKKYSACVKKQQVQGQVVQLRNYCELKH